ncbi:hypothetical protein [Sphingobacterium oryzagri]|uniref:hypothetical protein n=1 Tax=Sphingobacterium oryzagri TaxID=3025669 RepID=UPI003D182813
MKSYFEEVSATDDILIVPRNNNRDDAVIVLSVKTYHALTEIAYLLLTCSYRKRLKCSIEQLRGEV